MDKSLTRVEALKKIHEKYPLLNEKNTLLSQYIKIFIDACRENQVEILEAILLLKGITIAEKMHSGNNFKILESVIMYGRLEVLNKLIELAHDPINFDRVLHSKQDLIFILAVKSTSLRLVNRLIELTPDKTKLNKMIRAQGDRPFIVACENGLLKIANRLVELIDNLAMLNEMIHVDSDSPFRYAAENGHLNIVNRLVELTPAAERDTMIHAVKDYAFLWAAANGYLKIVNRLIALTPELGPREAMIHAEGDYAFRHACDNGYLSIVSRFLSLTPDPNRRRMMFNSLTDEEILVVVHYMDLNMSQYLMSFKPELKSFILKCAENDEFKQRIKDSDRFVQKLITSRKNGGEESAMEVFEYLKYGKSIFNLVRVSKSFINELRNSGLLEVLIDYLGNEDVALTKNEKICIFNILAIFSLDAKAKESEANILVPQISNMQNQKVSFVERVLAQKAASQEISLRSLA